MSENILLVEDEEAMRMVLSDRLRREGYFVDTAVDGENGFQKATSQPFNLMIFDIVLPRRNGLELCSDIRCAGLGTPVLMLTARRETEEMVAGFNAGADAYVTKPFDMLELMARIEALLRRVPGSGSKAPKAAQLPAKLARRSELPETRRINSQYVYPDLNGVVERKPLDELRARFAAARASTSLHEVVSRLRMMLDQEPQTSQTHSSASLRSVAEGVIEFLEEIFLMGSQRGQDSKQI
jgi:DNA-binding response OmpR family regulator